MALIVLGNIFFILTQLILFFLLPFVLYFKRKLGYQDFIDGFSICYVIMTPLLLTMLHLDLSCFFDQNSPKLPPELDVLRHPSFYCEIFSMLGALMQSVLFLIIVIFKKLKTRLYQTRLWLCILTCYLPFIVKITYSFGIKLV